MKGRYAKLLRNILLPFTLMSHHVGVKRLSHVVLIFVWFEKAGETSFRRQNLEDTGPKEVYVL